MMNLLAKLSIEDLLIRGGFEAEVYLLSSVVALMCVVMMLWVYQRTREVVEKSFVQNLVLVSLIATMIMVIASSYITNAQGKYAIAFILVGALSVIRFRMAVKNPEDLAYIFWAGGIGIGSGSIYYDYKIAVYVVACSAFIAAVMWLSATTQFFSKAKGLSYVLTVRLNPGHNPEQLLASPLGELFEEHHLISKEPIRNGRYTEAKFNVVPKVDVDDHKVVTTLNGMRDSVKVVYRSVG